MCLYYAAVVEGNTYPVHVSSEDHGLHQVPLLKPIKQNNTCVILETLFVPDIFHDN